MAFKVSSSTSELMRLVALAALNLVLFKGIWTILIVPPVLMTVVLVNLGLFCTIVRPRSLGAPVIAVLVMGIIVILGMLLYMSQGSFPPKPRIGLILHNSLPAAAYVLIPAPLRTEPYFLEYTVLDVLGISAMAASSWLTSRLFRRRKRSGNPSASRSCRSGRTPAVAQENDE
jgi:hypothetical protein